MAAEIIINCGAAKVARLPYGAAKWSQAMVSTVWHAMGYPSPAPIMPPSMEGWYRVATRGPRMLALTSKGRDGSLRGVTKEENKFWNFWGQAVEDPCRKQSGISKIAGGILQIASIYFPVMGYFQAAATAVNSVQDVKRQQDLVKSGTELLTAAALAQPQPMNPAPITTLPAPLSFAPTNPAPIVTAQPRPPTPTAPRRVNTMRDYGIALGVGLGLYLLLRRIRQR